jgi:hypothetical protein
MPDFFPQNPLTQSYARFESWALRLVENLCRGRQWLFVTALTATILSLVYAWPPYETLQTPSPSWAARWKHIDAPFEDPSKRYDPRSNEAKRTFRLTVPLIAHGLHLNRYGVIAMLHLCGILVFLNCAIAVTRITGDRQSAVICALTTAVIPTGSLPFWDFNIFFYDAVPLAMLTGAIAFHRSWAVLPLVFAAAWTDERALVTSSLLLLYFGYDAMLSTDTRRRLTSVACVAAVICAWVGYFVGRILLQRHYGFSTATGDVGLPVIISQINLLTIAAWGGLEGAWLVVGTALIILLTTRNFLIALCFSSAIALVSLIACSVFDLTRSFAYVYPALFLALRVLQQHIPTMLTRRLLLASFVISFFWLNLFLTGPNTVYLLKPLPFRAVSLLSSSVERCPTNDIVN